MLRTVIAVTTFWIITVALAAALVAIANLPL